MYLSVLTLEASRRRNRAASNLSKNEYSSGGLLQLLHEQGVRGLKTRGTHRPTTNSPNCCWSSHCEDCMQYGCDGSPGMDYHWCKNCEGCWCDDCVERGAHGMFVCCTESCDNISCGKCADDGNFFICPFCEEDFCKKCIPGTGSPCKDCKKKVQEGLLTYEEDYNDVYDLGDCW